MPKPTDRSPQPQKLPIHARLQLEAQTRQPGPPQRRAAVPPNARAGQKVIALLPQAKEIKIIERAHPRGADLDSRIRPEAAGKARGPVGSAD